MAILEASCRLNEAFLCLHYYTPAFPKIPMQWQVWRHLTGTMKLCFVDIVMNELFRTKQSALFMCTTIQPDPAIYIAKFLSMHSLQHIYHQSLPSHQVQSIYQIKYCSIHG